MATTRLMPLHTGKGRTVGTAISDIIDYVQNPQKTDNGRLITSYQCDSRIADAEFLFNKRQYIASTGRVRGTPKDTTIELQDVGFSYGDHRILNHVNLTIPAKTTTAIVGPSGSGKTTLCSLIARFWDVDEGCIKLGGTDIREYKLDSLLSNISMVFQNVFLFADSIENNIKFGKPNATHEEVVRAAKSACCHDFIMALPNGYDTVIGESGATLSGGEKQRISIARAILKDTPIIILDEATSSVDPENEAELQQAIEKLTEDKTVIIIAHRLKTVRNAQQIVVIANGGIVQRGTHQELMEQPGIYADFVNVREKAINWKLSGDKTQ